MLRFQALVLKLRNLWCRAKTKFDQVRGTTVEHLLELHFELSRLPSL